jgi:hypothetical protein
MVGRPDEKSITKDFTKIGRKSVDWMDLAHDRDQCRFLVNTVMKLGVPLKAGSFLTS